MTKAAISADETLTALNIGGLEVLQKKQGFRFALDAVLLAHFAQPKMGEMVGDIGAGCGVISVLLAHREAVIVDAIEIQTPLAEMLERTIIYNDLNNINVINEDVRALPKSCNNRYDLLVTNPPYFPVGKGKMSPSPEVALARHEIACTLEELLCHSARLLKSGGRLNLIHRAERLAEILLLCQTYKLTPKRLRLVHSMVDKGANLLLLEAKKGAKEGLTVEKPLIVYQSPGVYSEEVNCYFEGGAADV